MASPPGNGVPAYFLSRSNGTAHDSENLRNASLTRTATRIEPGIKDQGGVRRGTAGIVDWVQLVGVVATALVFGIASIFNGLRLRKATF
jgi:hypothetical protein